MSSKKRKNKVNEAAGDFSILRHPSPYRIGRAPAPVFNADEQMKMNHLMRSAEEVNNFIEKLQLVGKLEHLDPLIRDFYKQFANIYHFLDEQYNDVTLTKDMKLKIKELQGMFDKIGTTIFNDIIPMVDKLTES